MSILGRKDPFVCSKDGRVSTSQRAKIFRVTHEVSVGLKKSSMGSKDKLEDRIRDPGDPLPSV